LLTQAVEETSIPVGHGHRDTGKANCKLFNGLDTPVKPRRILAIGEIKISVFIIYYFL